MIYQLILVAMAVANCAEAATSGTDRQDLLDCHNDYRAKLALGQVGNQPKAADMTLMDYDTKIEAEAIEWNDQCKPGHDTSAERKVNDADYTPYFSSSYGQNWAGNSRSGISVKFSCDAWWKEYLDYSYSNNNSTGGAIGHYTQMAWAKSTVVGCGVKRSCTGVNQYTNHITCNYAAAGNYIGKWPYQVGEPCTKCPAEAPYCYENALCARADQCEGQSCTCKIQCQNGGTLDSSACTCSCPTGFYGAICEKPCQDDPENIYCPMLANMGGPDCSYCKDSYWQRVCSKTCAACKSAIPNPFITKVKGNTISRINQ